MELEVATIEDIAKELQGRMPHVFALVVHKRTPDGKQMTGDGSIQVFGSDTADNTAWNLLEGVVWLLATEPAHDVEFEPGDGVERIILMNKVCKLRDPLCISLMKGAEPPPPPPTEEE